MFERKNSQEKSKLNPLDTPKSFSQAIEANNLELVSQYLRQNPDLINQPTMYTIGSIDGPSKWTSDYFQESACLPLELAVAYGHLPMIKLLWELPIKPSLLSQNSILDLDDIIECCIPDKTEYSQHKLAIRNACYQQLKALIKDVEQPMQHLARIFNVFKLNVSLENQDIEDIKTAFKTQVSSLHYPIKNKEDLDRLLDFYEKMSTHFEFKDESSIELLQICHDFFFENITRHCSNDILDGKKEIIIEIIEKIFSSLLDSQDTFARIFITRLFPIDYVANLSKNNSALADIMITIHEKLETLLGNSEQIIPEETISNLRFRSF